ncbi:MAG: methyl-accepting chemotaxis protein, partial [Opitutales bacterium]
MSAVIAIFSIVLTGFGLYSAHTRAQVQIGGPYYTQIALGKDLVADILPPPAYIIEAYLLCYEAANTGSAAERTQALARLEQAEKEFHERQQVWRDALPESRMKAALVVDSAQEAEAFFKIVHTGFLPAVGAGDFDSARRLASGEMHAAYARHRHFIDEVVTLANQFNTDRENEATTVVHRGMIWETAIGVTGLLLGLLLGIGIIRGLGTTLRTLTVTLSNGAGQIASAAGQVSASSQSLAEGASEQAASLEETSASLEEMSSMTKRNAESSRQAHELAAQNRAVADTCVADMEQMKLAMDALRTSSGDISKIIKTIDEIAFQTNILALNAAVEAARAGEAGAGFAVVADEVRSLAQRAALSAKETASKIEIAVAKSEDGVSISGKVSASLGQIVGKARQIDTLVAEIATASQEQSAGIGQVNQAISQMDHVTQSNASGAEETAAAAEELNSQSQCLEEAVASLQRLVDGSAHAPARTAG